MRKCPYCAEDIQDEAIKCRWCGSDLLAPTPEAREPTEAPAGEPQTGEPPSEIRYTHTGHRYVLGYGPGFFGIWDRQAPAQPSERFTRDDAGWAAAWLRYSALEPGNVPVEGLGQAAQEDVEALQYTHSGRRYLLGYGSGFFAIWDRGSPAAPVWRFPRTDEGWREAWQRFASLEPHSTEVGIGGTGAPGAAPA